MFFVGVGRHGFLALALTLALTWLDGIGFLAVGSGVWI